MANRYYLILFCCVISMFGCIQNSLDPLSFVKWVENTHNGLKVEKKVGDYEFAVQYKPVDYIIAQELKESTIDKMIYDKEKQELGNLQYFTLNIKPSEGVDDIFKYKTTSPEEYYEKVNFFSFEAQNYIKLIDGNDTVNCALCHLERSYNVSPQICLLLAFEPSPEKENVPQSKTLIFDDPILGEGKIQITIDSDDIKSLPKIKTI